MRYNELNREITTAGGASIHLGDFITLDDANQSWEVIAVLDSNFVELYAVDDNYQRTGATRLAYFAEIDNITR
jgi:hypothetical protein